MAFYPVTPGEEIRLDYLKGPAVKLVANYVNIMGQDSHFTICSEDVNEFGVGALHEEIALPFAKGHESQIEQWPVTRLSKRS